MDFLGIGTQIAVVVIVRSIRRITSPDMRERSANNSSDKGADSTADQTQSDMSSHRAIRGITGPNRSACSETDESAKR